MLLALGVILLALGVGYLLLDGRVHRQEAALSEAPRPAYTCQECGRRVDYRTTVRPIRLTLLCPDDYHRRFGALPPAPTPEMERRSRRRRHGPGPRPPMMVLPRR